MSTANDNEMKNATGAENGNVNTTTVAVTEMMVADTTTTAAAATTTPSPTITTATSISPSSPATMTPAETITITTTTTNAPTMMTMDTVDSSAIVAMKTPMKNGENNNGNASSIQPHEEQQKQQPQLQMQLQQHPQMQQTTTSNKDKMDNDAGLANFKVLYVLAQLSGLTLVVLMGCWVGVHMGGVGGTANPSLEFNWHPLLMTIGLIFLYGNSILVYRGFRNTRKKTLKLAHAGIHITAFILTVIALKTVFDSHNLPKEPIPNMYSLHSWLGIATVVIFCMQYVAGFMAYLVPGFKESIKIALMPLHIYFGLFGFVLAIACALMGLTEKAIFSTDYKALPSAAVVANICGVMLVIFGGLVVYLTTEPSYKRKPIPEDAILLTGASE